MTPRRTLPLLVSLCALALASPPEGALPVPGKPSIPRGKERFQDACAACHPSVEAFVTRAWRDDLAPADVARLVMGGGAGEAAGDAGRSPSDTSENAAGQAQPGSRGEAHPAVLTDLQAGWETAGYVWSLGTDGREVRRGEALALEAADALEKDALNVALFHQGELQQLRSAEWVLNHTQADVIDLMARLAGRRFGTLGAVDRRALAEYITLSYFVWPSDW